MAKKVTVDADLCIGCGACTAICSAFALNDEGKAAVVAEGDDEAIDTAVASCPVQAIAAE